MDKSIRQSTPRELHIFLSDFYDEISYDDSPPFKDYVPVGIWFTLLQEEMVAGFINLEPMNNVMWNAHVMIYTKYRRNGSEEWAVLVAQWARQHLRAKKFLAITPYIAAKKYAERAGFVYVAMLTNSIKKNGKLMDQFMLELGEQE